MTRLQMICKMYSMYGKDSKITRQFCQLMKNPDIKKRHLEKIVKAHEERFKDLK